MSARIPPSGSSGFSVVLHVLPIVLLLFASPLPAQDRFPTPVPLSDLDVFITDVATLPDSSTGDSAPARMSVLTTDPSGRLFVNDQRGPLYFLDLSGGKPAGVTEYLDLRDFSALQLLSASGEQGFQAFAFHPDFFSTGEPGYGLFYTILSSGDTSPTPDFDPGGSEEFHTVLLEWQTSDPAASTFMQIEDQPAFREILRFKQPFGNHNAGLIAFNPTVDANDADYGNLYIALGDGGSGNDPQENGEDPSNPFGAILRINPLGNNSANGKYGLVAANVLASDNDASTLAEIYCYGLRNPQRFAWDPANGDLFIADIGQGVIEEINLAANGADFGWDNREGSFPKESNTTAGFTDPVAEYDHTGPVADVPTGISNRAITTGEVARETNLPGMNGQLVFSDFPTGLLFVLNVDTDPLEGGQDGIFELKPVTPQGDPIHMLDLINQTRVARGLNTSTRADTRFGIHTPGRIFVLNKKDGVVRELVAPPSVQVRSASGGQLRIDFTGTLLESTDLANDPFEAIDPQPETPWIFTPDTSRSFFRSGVE